MKKRLLLIIAVLGLAMFTFGFGPYGGFWTEDSGVITPITKGGTQLTIDGTIGSSTPAVGTFTEVELTGVNVKYLLLTDNIETEVAAATAGDSLILAAGTYTITDDIDITKSIRIIGQGVEVTKIVTTTDSKNCFHITANDVEISNLTIDVTADDTHGIKADGTGGTVLSDVSLHDLELTLNSHAGVQHAICFYDASGEIKNVEFTVTSSDDSASGIYVENEATAEAATEVHAHNCHATVIGGGGTASAFAVYDDSATYDCTLRMFNSHGVVTEGAACTSGGLAAYGGADALAYAEYCYFDATDYDLYQATSATLTVRACTLDDNSTSGTITEAGTILAKDIQTTGTITLDDGTTDSPKLILKDSDNEQAEIYQDQSSDDVNVECHDASDSLAVTVGNISAGTPAAGVITLNGGDLFVADDAEIDGTLAVDTDLDVNGTANISGLTTLGSVVMPFDESTDAALTVDGEMHIRGDEDRISYDMGAGGEVAGEVTKSVLYQVCLSVDPGSWYDSDTELFIMEVDDSVYPNGIIIDEWKLSCNIDPDVEIDADLRYADAWIGLANPNDIDEIDTATGTSTENTDANINSGAAVAADKVIYIGFDADPEGTCVQMHFEMIFHAVES